MAPATALRLRPLPLSELLDELFRMYRRNFVLMATAALVLEIPGLVFNLLSGQYKTFGFFFNIFSNVGNPDRIDALAQPPPNLIYLLMGYVVVLLLLPVSAGFLIRLSTDIAMGRPTSVLGALRRTIARYLGLAAFLLMAAVAGLVVGAVLVLVVASGIALGSAGRGNGLIVVASVLIAMALGLAAFLAGAWLAVRLLVTVPAMLEEGIGPLAGMRRSWNLLRGSFWRVVGTLLVIYVLVQVVQTALSGVSVFLAVLLPGLSGDARGALFLVLLTLAQVVTSPLLAITVALIYFDLRVRNEAMDLDQLAQAANPSPLPPPVLASPLPPPAEPQA